MTDKYVLEPQGDDIDPEDIEDEVYILDADGRPVLLEVPDDGEEVTRDVADD